jgi:peptide deformylase
MLELKTYPESCLRKKTNPVKNFETDLSKTIRAMGEVMYINNGIGLAATQVGIDSRFLVFDIGEGLQALVNPEITKKSKKTSCMEEGCLSLPGIAVSVKRPSEISVKAQDETGKSAVKKFTGLMATVIQHEIDHLDGKLLIDYMNPVKRLMAARKLARDKRKR